MHTYYSTSAGVVSRYVDILNKVLDPYIFERHFPSGYFPASLLPDEKAELTRTLELALTYVPEKSLGYAYYQRLLGYLTFFIDDAEAHSRNSSKQS